MVAVVAVLAPITYAVMLGIERIFPARGLPEIRGWLAKGVLFFVFRTSATGLIAVLAAHACTAPPLFDARSLGAIGGGFAGFLIADFVLYGAHRLCHVLPFLWRWVHQMHH